MKRLKVPVSGREPVRGKKRLRRTGHASTPI
jgi:hypothetical protein